MKFALRRVRENANLNQTQLGEAVGKDYKTISNWEKGKTYPNAEQIFSICTACNCSPNELFCWTKEDEIFYQSREQKILNDCYENMNGQGQATLVTVAQSLQKDAANRIVKDREERLENQQGA